MAYHLLERNREGGRHLAGILMDAMNNIGNCSECRTFCESAVCELCANQNRDRTQLCVVENPADVLVLEQSIGYKGRYFVLMGHLSPIDGIGPDELGMSQLVTLLGKGEIQEIILATNPTVEGEATAHYIGELARARKVKATRIAHGVPLGGELEYIDGGTLAHAFAGRQQV